MKCRHGSLIFFILLLLFCPALMAAPPETGTNPNGLTVEGDNGLTVILKPSSDMSSYEFGFSATPVTQWTTNPTEISSSFTLQPFLDKETGVSYATLKTGQNLYVYWRMYTLKGITLSLSQSGALTLVENKTGENAPSVSTIDWGVYWKGEAVAEESPAALDPVAQGNTPKLHSSKAGSVVLRDFAKMLTLQNNAGSVQLFIKTDSIEGKSVSGTYKGSLVLEVKVNQ